jgi:hypothetical protein
VNFGLTRIENECASDFMLKVENQSDLLFRVVLEELLLISQEIVFELVYINQNLICNLIATNINNNEPI